VSQKLKFSSTPPSFFYATVRKKVDLFFSNEKLSQHANAQMWFKVAFFITGFIVLYALILTGYAVNWLLLPLAAALGIFCAFVGFNVCHDALHGALSGNKNVNKLFGFFFNLIGASPYLWKITHNLIHHTFTNIPGHDDDIVVAPGLIRISEEEEVNAIQRYQHWYAFPLYSIASISWVFVKDYLKFFQKKIGAHQATHPKIEYFNLFFYKGLYYFLYIVLPLMVLDVTCWQFLLGFMVLQIAQGLTMGLVFQLAHVVEGTTFPTPNIHGQIEEAWAEHQMRTTANFATQSKLAAFFLGGLNRQIEHHLFPKVCHIHYGEISEIIKQTALEFNLPYIENKSFLSALHSHFLTLKRLGKDAAKR